MDVTKMDIIGRVTTIPIKYETFDSNNEKVGEHELPKETYNVVDIFEENGKKFYVTNRWYKEYKQVPLIIIDGIVESYEPITIKCHNCSWTWAYKDGGDDKFICHKCGADNSKYYKNGGQILLAPNGKPSKLTPEQYKLVRTKAFKDWFGDWENDSENSSKVVDENGEPLVCYHGVISGEDWNTYEYFDNEKPFDNPDINPIGIYMSSNIEEASNYGSVIKKLFCKIIKPLDLSETKTHTLKQWLIILNKSGLDISNIKFDSCFIEDYAKYEAYNSKGEYMTQSQINNVKYLFWELIKINSYWVGDGNLLTEIIKQKYDGIFYLENTDESKREISECIAFKPNQIKLADGTNTTFDSNNPDIRYKNGGGVEDYVANDYLQKKYNHLKTKNAKFEDLPEIYIRIGLPKKVKDKYLPSRNHYLGILEDGISVFTARYSPNSKFVFVDLESDRNSLFETYTLFREEIRNGSKNKMYLLEGNPLLSGDGNYQVGADDERLLNTKGVKVIGELNPKKIIIYDKGTPSRDKSIIYYDTETLSGNKLKKYPKYANGGLTMKKPKAELLAPNGKPSNLTPEQYRLVRTPEFKAWFGDWENDAENASKVIDKNGEPLVVYHGTDSDMFYEFNSKLTLYRTYRKNRNHFVDSIEVAKSYGKNVIAVFLKIKKPKIFDYQGAEYTGKAWYKVTGDYGTYFNPKFIKDVNKSILFSNKGELIKRAIELGHNEDDIWIEYDPQIQDDINDIAETIENSSYYDGIIAKNILDVGMKSVAVVNPIANQYIIFNSKKKYRRNQIKLADGTNTTFDSNNPDIRYKNGGYIGSCVDVGSGKKEVCKYFPDATIMAQYVGNPDENDWGKSKETTSEEFYKFVSKYDVPKKAINGEHTYHYIAEDSYGRIMKINETSIYFIYNIDSDIHYFFKKTKYEIGGELTLTSEQVENKLGRKLHYNIRYDNGGEINNIQLLKHSVINDFQSGSSLDFYMDYIFVVGDDAKDIVILNKELQEVNRVNVFQSETQRIPKEIKYDLETSTIVDIDGVPNLLILGSGAKQEFRSVGYLIRLDTKYVINEPFKYNTFVSRLKNEDSVKEINIEGCASLPNKFIMANRGNKRNPDNLLIITENRFWENQENAAISICRILIPDKDAAVSEIQYEQDTDTLFFTASIEHTTNAIDDGKIGDSFLGYINNISEKLTKNTIDVDGFYNLSLVDKAFEYQKIEGICIESKEKEMNDTFYTINLVSDNDNEESTIFKIRFKKPN